MIKARIPATHGAIHGATHGARHGATHQVDPLRLEESAAASDQLQQKFQSEGCTEEDLGRCVGEWPKTI